MAGVLEQRRKELAKIVKRIKEREAEYAKGGYVINRSKVQQEEYEQNMERYEKIIKGDSSLRPTQGDIDQARRYANAKYLKSKAERKITPTSKVIHQGTPISADISVTIKQGEAEYKALARDINKNLRKIELHSDTLANMSRVLLREAAAVNKNLFVGVENTESALRKELSTVYYTIDKDTGERVRHVRKGKRLNMAALNAIIKRRAEAHIERELKIRPTADKDQLRKYAYEQAEEFVALELQALYKANELTPAGRQARLSSISAKHAKTVLDKERRVLGKNLTTDDREWLIDNLQTISWLLTKLYDSNQVKAIRSEMIRGVATKTRGYNDKKIEAIKKAVRDRNEQALKDAIEGTFPDD